MAGDTGDTLGPRTSVLSFNAIQAHSLCMSRQVICCLISGSRLNRGLSLLSAWVRAAKSAPFCRGFLALPNHILPPYNSKEDCHFSRRHSALMHAAADHKGGGRWVGSA
jgi:hypothetical protein